MESSYIFISQILDPKLLIRIVSGKSQYMPLSCCLLSRQGEGKHPIRLIAPQETPVVAGVNARFMDFTLSASWPVLCDALEPFRRFAPNHTARTA